MGESKYQKLFNLSNRLKRTLENKKKKGLLDGFSVDSVPDDGKIEIHTYYKVPTKLKEIKTTIFIGKKNEDTK